MTILDRDGVKFFCEEAGTGDPPMLFVHGWTCDHSYFAPQFNHFKQSARVVALDLRGHGASGAPEGDYSMAALADDVAWLCGELGVEQAVVVGHSMGAIIGIELAAHHPQLVSAAVLVDPAPIVLEPGLAALLPQLVEGMGGPDSFAVRRGFIEGMLFLPTDDPVVKGRVLEDMLAVPNHVAFGCFQGLGAWDGEAALQAVGVPVLAIHADQPINDPDTLAALCPTLTNVHTPGVGHFNQLLAAEQVNRLIEDFLG
jgi:pimeloyl-ACP methyl ester carboxylesterase